VYWTPGCGFCARAKAALDALGLAWESVDVGSGPDAAAARSSLAARTGQTSVPQLFVGDLRLGGYDDLVQLRDSGDLEAMVQTKGLLKAAPTPTASTNADAAAFVDVKALHDPASGVLNVLKSGTVCNAGGSAVEVRGASLDMVATLIIPRAVRYFQFAIHARCHLASIRLFQRLF
jgi:glutaredoxin 3